jgi:hypothetical protein
VTAPIVDPAARMKDVHLAFAVSPDEEYVTLHATIGGTTVDMTSRHPRYDLLLLARKRLADLALGLPDDECGWTNCKALEASGGNWTQDRLGLEVHKLRFQFRRQLPIFDPEHIFERRPDGSFRIGTSHLSVSRLT